MPHCKRKKRTEKGSQGELIGKLKEKEAENGEKYDHTPGGIHGNYC